MAAQQFNPFASLITPEVLEAQREAEFAAKYQQADPWVRGAAEAGFKIGQVNRSRGIGLTEDDLKAKRNQEIMSQSQAKYSEAMASGTMDADEAQAVALEDAIKGFAQNGNWEQALALTQPLAQLKSQALERRKLKAEAINIESKPDAKEVDQAIAAAKAQQAYDAKIQQLELAAMRAQTAADRAAAQNALNGVQSEFLLWKMQQEKDNPKDKKESAQAYKERVKMNTGVRAAAETADLMADLRESIASNPGAATLAGDLLTKVMKYGEATKALVAAGGYDPKLTKDGTKVGDWLRQNVDNEAQHAQVIALAYAFARAQDPGGRLSNQDLEQAARVVSGEGSPASRITLLDNAFTRIARAAQGQMETGADNDLKLGENTKAAVDASFKRYKSLVEQTRPQAQPATPAAAGGPPPGMSREQFLEWKRANPNWKP